MAISPFSSVSSDPTTLAANREGRITDLQRRILKSPSAVSVLVAQILVLASVAVMALGAYFFLIQPLSGLLSNIGASWTALATPSFWTANLPESVAFPILFVVFTGIILWYMLAPATRRLQAKARLHADMVAGSVDQADGQVSYGGKRGYLARTARGATLYSTDGGRALDLAPGAYHFFFLRRSRRILSAERQAQFEATAPNGASGIVSPNALLTALAKANGFSLRELELNRRGQISVRQRFKGIVRVVFTFAITAGVLAVAGVLLVKQGYLGAVVTFGVALFFLSLSIRSAAILLAGRVETLEGIGRHLIDSVDEPPPVYYYTIGERKFHVGLAAYNALVSGQQYRLYALGSQLLSIEPLR